MNKLLILALLFLGVLASQGEFLEEEQPNQLKFGTYFVNWGQWRQAPYTYQASHLAPIANKLTHIYYAFQYFCPPPGFIDPYWITQLGLCQGKQPFDVIMIEPKDHDFIRDLNNFKQQNPNLKVISSIGGWNFPSSYFREAFATQANRQSFIRAIIAFVNEYQMDGVDIDWEYPCSEPRTNYVKISNEMFHEIDDAGGDCPSGQFEKGVCSGECHDGDNLLAFFREFKETAPDMYISIAASANTFAIERGYKVAEMDQYVDNWNLMSYDFWVAGIDSATFTAPNQNYANVEALDDNWGVKACIDGYKNNGVTPSKLILGLAYYGHHWLVPGITDDSWQQFNLPTTIQGKCFGPFQQTYGGKPGQGTGQCGTTMYPEIVAAGFEVYHDEATTSDIGYLKQAGSDGGYTEVGTWVAFQTPSSLAAQTQLALDEGLGGAFIFDSSMDTISGSSFTYEISHLVAGVLGH